MARHYRDIPPSAIWVNLPDTTQQTRYSCGASSLQSIAKYFGLGPDDEWEFVNDLHMDKRVGSHPDQIVTAATRYGLATKLYLPMTLKELHAELRQNHPVMLMIQAWGAEGGGNQKKARSKYADWWADGHWVVAIGFDDDAVYFEDPSLQAVRGYLLNHELEERWHDTARHNVHMEHLGLAIWLEGIKQSAYHNRAQRIE